MTDSPTAAPPEAPPAGQVGDFPLLVETPPPGLLGRYFTTQRHVLGLIFGGIRAWTRSQKAPHPRFYGLARFVSALASPSLDRELRDLPFPIQLRKRLEILGPTYIKLGQVLSLREDILPPRDHRGAQEPPRPPARGPARAREGDHRARPQAPGGGDVLVDRPGAARLGLDRAGAPRAHRRRRGRDHQGRQAGQPRDPEARHDPPQPARPLPADLPRAGPAAPGAARVHRLHAARARPAPRGRQRRDLRRQLPRHAGRRLPEDLSRVLGPRRADDGVPRRRQADLGRGARAARSKSATSWSTSAPPRSSACSTGTASSTPTCIRAT